MSQISIQNLGYVWPDGHVLFQNLNFNIRQEKIGLVGDNGCGKTTLLRLIQGILQPSQGYIDVEGKLAVVRQTRTVDPTQSVIGFLGIAPQLRALRRILAGAGTEADLITLNDKWDLETGLEALMAQAGLSHIGLERRLESLSGGELSRLALAAAWLRDPDFILLDEPTNHLDTASRTRLHDMIRRTRAGVLVVSHDRALLRGMEAILELSSRGLHRYGGNFDDYCEQKNREQAAAEAALESVRNRMKQQERNAREQRERQEKRNAAAAKQGKKQNLPKVVINQLKGQAEKTLHKGNAVQENRSRQLREEWGEMKSRVDADRRIHIDLEGAPVHRGKVVIRLEGLNFHWPGGDPLWPEPLDWSLHGSEKVWLQGANGSGKSTLIRLITGTLSPGTGKVYLGVDQVLLLDQELSLLDPEKDLLDNLRRFAPSAMPEHELRTRLARFLFRDDKVFQPAAQLSGGERMRLALACLLAMEKAPGLLILDEPTNNLDLRSTGELAGVLSGFPGALLLVTHDADFAREIGVEGSLDLDRQSH